MSDNEYYTELLEYTDINNDVTTSEYQPNSSENTSDSDWKLIWFDLEQCIIKHKNIYHDRQQKHLDSRKI